MAKSTGFTVDGTEFRLVNHPGGTEEIYVKDELASKVKSIFGGKHEFVHGGDTYEMKVKAGLGGLSIDIKKNGEKKDDGLEKVPPLALVACGWPLLLVGIGGAIGGGLGGAAAAANFAIYKSDLPLGLKIVLNIGCGAAAFGLWVLAASTLR